MVEGKLFYTYIEIFDVHSLANYLLWNNDALSLLNGNSFQLMQFSCNSHHLPQTRKEKLFMLLLFNSRSRSWRQLRGVYILPILLLSSHFLYPHTRCSHFRFVCWNLQNSTANVTCKFSFPCNGNASEKVAATAAKDFYA